MIHGSASSCSGTTGMPGSVLASSIIALMRATDWLRKAYLKNLSLVSWSEIFVASPIERQHRLLGALLQLPSFIYSPPRFIPHEPLPPVRHIPQVLAMAGHQPLGIAQVGQMLLSIRSMRSV